RRHPRRGRLDRTGPRPRDLRVRRGPRPRQRARHHRLSDGPSVSEPTRAGRRESPEWLRNEAIIAGRLLLIGLAVAGGIWLALQVQFIAVAVMLGFAE